MTAEDGNYYAVLDFTTTDLAGRLAESLRATKCSCDIRVVLKCPDCGRMLRSVPRDARFNEDQWDAIKAGDFYCTGECTSSQARSGKKYWRTRDLPTETIGQCNRCTVLAEYDAIRAATRDHDDADREEAMS